MYLSDLTWFIQNCRTLSTSTACNLWCQTTIQSIYDGCASADLLSFHNEVLSARNADYKCINMSRDFSDGGGCKRACKDPACMVISRLHGIQMYARLSFHLSQQFSWKNFCRVHSRQKLSKQFQSFSDLRVFMQERVFPAIKLKTLFPFSLGCKINEVTDGSFPLLLLKL